MYRAEPYLKGTSAPNRYLLSEKSASKGGGEGFKKSQQKTDFFNFDSFPYQAYFAGKIKGSEFDGWVGKEDKNPAALMKELSLFKSSNDCPQVKANIIKLGV